MPDPSRSRAARHLLRIYVISAAALFAVAEFLSIVELVHNHQTRVDARLGFYLLPFLVASPPIAVFQAYLHIQRNLISKGVDRGSWPPIWYELALLLAIVCGVSATTLAVLLTRP
jgi:hypothetical protein